MRAIESFSLEKHDGPYDKWPSKTLLFAGGRSTGRKIPGYVIEAQYELEPGYVVITSQDCPFEESNDLLFLDRSFRVRARRWVGWPYETFLLHAHWPLSETKLALHYVDSLIYTLEVSRGLFGLGWRLSLTRMWRNRSIDRVPGARESINKLAVILNGHAATRAAALKPHWDEAWSELGLSPPAGLFGEVARAHEESHRAYHTLRHLEECFAWFGEAKRLCAHPGEVMLALWFHDAVYQPAGRDNEEASAKWAERVLREAGAAPEAIGRVRDLILATRHEAQPASDDAQVLVDIDLAILAADAARFDEYETQVRKEYAHVPGMLFRIRRARILKGFLARPSIYSTAHFRERLEAQARANLERSLGR